MIKIQIIKYKSAQQELNVVNRVRFYHEDKPGHEMFGKATLTAVESALKNDINSIPRTNVFSADNAYKISRHSDDAGQHLRVQHYTVTGDADRLIAIIRDDEKPYNNWID